MTAPCIFLPPRPSYFRIEAEEEMIHFLAMSSLTLSNLDPSICASLRKDNDDVARRCRRTDYVKALGSSNV